MVTARTIATSPYHTVLEENIYEPYGKKIPIAKIESDRLSFIGKEKDLENKLGDFGVRKYDGRYWQVYKY